MSPVYPLALDSILTITFINHGRGGVICTWVCESPRAYAESIDELKDMEHIEIIASGPSVIKRKGQMV